MDVIAETQAEIEQEEPVNTADPVQVNRARKKAARTRADRLKFIEAALQHEQGRAWFYDILVFCQIFDTPFSTDPYITSFKCGKQECGRRILSDVELFTNNYLQMLKENR